MPDDPTPLRPATTEEITESLSFALRYQGRKRVHHADHALARITALRLVECLEAAGYVLMTRPDGVAPSTSRFPVPGQER